MSISIQSLPDFPSLKKFASALWQQNNSCHGAAIMIGAGFSRCASSTGDINRKLPLWNDLAKILARELDSNSQEPLRLAEEFSAYFGKQTLQELIQNELNDTAWTPSEMYRNILELPWTDILTTNWDTLLERAAIDVHNPVYNLVVKQEDLSSTRAPRIIKLHGTIDITKELIFTQEDYRKYPQKYAAFVNLARQIFIENELCLLGFSGDDPNFLQWAGWVRDNLDFHSRRIYLVGALGLTPAKRKYLNSINVIPIDLAELVTEYDDADVKHQIATKLFIQSLNELKPQNLWEWSPACYSKEASKYRNDSKKFHDPEYAAKLFEKELPLLKKHRESYPNWLVCPPQQHQQLLEQIQETWIVTRCLPYMNKDSQAQLLYEIAWFYQITNEIIPSRLTTQLISICNIESPNTLTKKEQLEIAILLLKNTRWLDETEGKPIIEVTCSIIKKGIIFWPDCNNELEYYHALVARDNFDYLTLEKHIDNITTTQSIWKLRKASLLTEICDYENSKKLVYDAYNELLSQYRNDQNSIYILSRLSWAHWLIMGIERWSSDKTGIPPFPSSYKEKKCCPWEYIEFIKERITNELNQQEEQQSIEPSFEPGRYKDNSKKIYFSNKVHPLILFESSFDMIGLPLKWEFSSFLCEHASSLTKLQCVDNKYKFSLTIRSAMNENSIILKKVFSRIQVACLPQENIDILLNQCLRAIEYWDDKQLKKSSVTRNQVTERLQVFLEILARISIRTTPEQAKRIFHLTVNLSKRPDINYSYFEDTIKHLIEFSMESIPKLQHNDILYDALSFPIYTEVGLKYSQQWPNPIITTTEERELNTKLDFRIAELINFLEPDSPSCTPSLLRLLPLIKNNFLTTEELNKIEEKIWGKNPDWKIIPDTGLLVHTLLSIPSKNHRKIRSLIRNYLFNATKDDLLNSLLLNNIICSSLTDEEKEFPKENQAIKYFEYLIQWENESDDRDIMGFTKQKNESKAALICKALARSIVPALATSELTEDNFIKLLNFYRRVKGSELLVAFSYFAEKNESIAEQLESLIKLGLQSKDANEIAYTSYALLTWRKLTNSPRIEKLILRMIYQIGTSRIAGLAALLWTMRQLHNYGYLSEQHIDSLINNLPIIFENSSYFNISPDSYESVHISLVRAACIKLAKDIQINLCNNNHELQQIIIEAKQDPLPEVRFA